MTSPVETVLDVIRRHQGSGRALLHRIVGPPDLELQAEGSWVIGLDGRRYLDFGSFAVFLLGHRNQRVVHAVRAQLDLIALSSRTFASPTVGAALEAVASVAPAGLTKVMLLNSGAETVEAAIKLARATTGRPGLVHLAGSFHGKTTGALALTDANLFRDPFRPLLADVVRVPRDDPEAAQRAIEATRPAAVFVEAVQGEGGVYELDAAVLHALRRGCDETGALLVADEIQCGLGRTGTMWGVEAAGVVPDVVLIGKALGGGVLPASALVATPAAFRPYDRDPLLHTSTFGGSPIAAAAITATLGVIADDDVPALARAAGLWVRALLTRVAAAAPSVIADVRGRGLMAGLVCRDPKAAGMLLRATAHRGLLLTPCLTEPRVVRVFPPAFVTDAELRLAEDALTDAAVEVAADLRSPEPATT